VRAMLIFLPGGCVAMAGQTAPGSKLINGYRIEKPRAQHALPVSLCPESSRTRYSRVVNTFWRAHLSLDGARRMV